MDQINLKEKIKQQIISDTKNEMFAISRYFSRLEVVSTSVDKSLVIEDRLPKEMIFKEGVIPKLYRCIFLVAFVSFVFFSILNDNFKITDGNIILISLYLLFICFTIFYLWIVPKNEERIILSEEGILLTGSKFANWNEIEETYIKSVIGGKIEQWIFIIAFKDETYKEQKFSNKIGSGYKNIAHYTELYKRNCKY